MLPACLAAVNGDRIPAGFVGKDAGKGEVIGDAVLSVLEEAVREILKKQTEELPSGALYSMRGWRYSVSISPACCHLSQIEGTFQV